MKPDEISAIAAVAQAVLALAALIGSIAISVFVYSGSKRIARMEYERSVREAWNNLDAVALSSDEMLKIADQMMDPLSAARSLEERRRRWFAYLVLNALASSYVGAQQGLTKSPKGTLDICEHHLNRLLLDKDIFELTQQGYEGEFMALCRVIHKKLQKKKEGESDPQPSSNKSFDRTRR